MLRRSTRLDSAGQAEHVVRQFREALAFLTRLPGGAHPTDGGGLTAVVPWFPVVGLLVGAVGAGTYVGLAELVSPLVAAAITFALTALITGGFHEDGLADSLDALAGGWDREQRLAILKDSRHGTFGVLALVFISIIKVSALSELAGREAALAVLCAHCAGRAGAVALMGVAPVATEEGLGADYTRSLKPVPALLGSLVGVAAVAVSFGWAAPVVLGVLAAGVAVVGVWAYRKIGGVTGDLLGAAEQVGEAAVLVVAAALI